VWKLVFIAKALTLQTCSSPTCSSSPLVLYLVTFFCSFFLLVFSSSSSMSFFFSLFCYAFSPPEVPLYLFSWFYCASPPPYSFHISWPSQFIGKKFYQRCVTIHFIFLFFGIFHFPYVTLREMYESPWIVCKGN